MTLPLFAPFEFQFMLNAFIMICIVSVPASLLSCYLVLKGWALLGDAIGHAVLPGIVLAYLLKLPLLLGAFTAGMCCALLTGFFSQNSRIKRDTVMGVVFSGMFALGLLIYFKVNTELHLDHILFGNIMGISFTDILVSSVISIFVTSIVVLKRLDLLLHSFDPVQCQVIGLNTSFLYYGLLMLVSLTVVATLSSVGIILAIGLLIAPGAIAFLITRKFTHMLITAIAVSLMAGIAGVYSSFFFDSAPAPTVILTFSLIFLIVFSYIKVKKVKFDFNP